MVNCCKNCSLELVGKYQLKFCSKKCASVFYNKNIKGQKCPHCNNTLYKRWNDHIKKCLEKTNNKKTNIVKNTKSLKKCIECEISFKSKRKTHKFCSNTCYISWREKNPIHRTEKEKANLRNHIMARYKNGWMPKAGRCKKIKYFSPIAGNITLDGTWELYVAKYLDLKNLNWKRNKKRFRYINLDNKISYYTPDFYVKEFNGYLEVKGYETDLDRCKWAQFKENLIIWKEKDISTIKELFKNKPFTENKMSRTFKTQRAYRAYKETFDELTIGMQRRHAINDAMRDAGQRYGNQRKMRAKLKVAERRIRRRKENRSNLDTE